jgi:predicted naringenin-chalcone synthase
MSSATVLFVLKHILDLPQQASSQETAHDSGGERICSMAFGPGLTVETGLFTKISQPSTHDRTADESESSLA